jgi:tetratricopeptide (TPR) repeat protein
VFDDVWTSDDALIFRGIGTNCQRMMTTRFLDVAADFAQPEPVIEVPELDLEESMTLLRQLAPDVVATAPEDVSEVVSRIGGVPLALVIVGMNVQREYRRMGLGGARALLQRYLEVQSRLEEVTALPSDHAALPKGRSRSLLAMIDLTAEDLTVDERVSLTALSAFPPKANSFSLEAGTHVAGAEVHLRTLRSRGLLELSDPVRARMTMHQAIADYASRAGTEPTAYSRMAAYFLNYVNDRRREAEDAETWLPGLEDEQENIRAAVEWSIRERDSLLGLQLMAALWPYWYQRSRFQRGLELAERIIAIDLAPDASVEHRLLRSKVLNDAGNFAYNMADLAKAERHYRAAIKVREELGREDLAAGSWNNLGLVRREQGAYDEATALFDKAYRVNVRTGKREWEAMNLNNLGITRERLGDYEAAIEFQRDSGRIFEALGDRWGVAMTSIDLGSALLGVGHVDEAEQVFLDVLPQRFDRRDRKAVAGTLRGLARVALRRADAAGARDLFLAALTSSLPITDRLGAGLALEGLVVAAASLADIELGARAVGALDAYRQATGVVPSPARRSRLDDALARLETDPARFTEHRGKVRAAALGPKGDLQLDQAVSDHLGDIDVDAVVGRFLSPETP